MAYACYAANCERKICNTYSKIKMAIVRRCWIVQIISAMRASELCYIQNAREVVFTVKCRTLISPEMGTMLRWTYKCICNCAIPLNLKALRATIIIILFKADSIVKKSYQKPNQILDRKKRAPLFLVQLGHLIFELQPLGGK